MNQQPLTLEIGKKLSPAEAKAFTDEIKHRMYALWNKKVFGGDFMRDLEAGRLPFETINRPLKKKEISKIINASFRRCGLRETVIFADKLMQSGFTMATRGGISFGVQDMRIPTVKQEMIGAAEAEVKEIESQYTSGLVTVGERYNKVVDIWSRCGEQVGKSMMEQLGSETVENRHVKMVK